MNNVPRVAPRTRERVLAAIKALDYEPNNLARGLSTSRTKTIGVVVYDIANPYYGQLVRGMEDAAFSRGYDLIIGNSDADALKDHSYLRVFHRRRVDGILATIADPSRDDLGTWTRASCPVVFLDKFFCSENCSYVTVNNRQAASQAVDHLLEHRPPADRHSHRHHHSERLCEGAGSPGTARRLPPARSPSTRRCLRRANDRARRAAIRGPGSSCAERNGPPLSSASTTPLPSAPCGRYSRRASRSRATSPWSGSTTSRSPRSCACP